MVVQFGNYPGRPCKLSGAACSGHDHVGYRPHLGLDDPPFRFQLCEGHSLCAAYRLLVRDYGMGTR